MKEIKKMELEKKIKIKTEAIGCYIFLLLIIGVPSLLTTFIFSNNVALIITLSLAIIVPIIVSMLVIDIKRNKSKLEELDNDEKTQ